MSETWVEDWDAQEAWNQKCGREVDSAAVKKLKGMIRIMLASRDEAEATLERLREKGLPDDALVRLVDEDGFLELHEAMKENGDTVLLGDDHRRRWNKGAECDRDIIILTTIEERIRRLELDDETLRFWLLMYPQYEEIQRLHVAFASFCNLLQVDPEGEQTWEAFRRWDLLCRYEQLADEIIAAECCDPCSSVVAQT